MISDFWFMTLPRIDILSVLFLKNGSACDFVPVEAKVIKSIPWEHYFFLEDFFFLDVIT